ncbi:hypothetical protein ACOZ4Y_07970 [Komagataeibacter rhaeticus]|uniref:hypothetical protein n=1 Tax=Komagataeibacter rhaeticus TaxID=215221 RepID=UPI000AF07A94|nr:hypothetical protein [Komagataeibacter rhaeticus]MBL7239719.1 hypothetical protein [Komagataeibacter rhaeticus]MDT8870223.1 hypothetical protein [Komagataeibacter rhaeticus]
MNRTAPAGLCHLASMLWSRMLWPRHGGCYRRVSVWLGPDMGWLERPRPLDI